MSCPICELVDALHSWNTVPLAWVVRWSADGVEPVAAAWKAATDPASMLVLIAFVQGLGNAYSEAMAAALPMLGLDPRICDAIRRAAPPPATLAELLSLKTEMETITKAIVGDVT